MVNYDNSIIYKLCCKDTSVIDIYVGSTTNFRSRKYKHKNKCNSENSKNHNNPVYKFIRDKGGWDNWDMVEVEKYKATDKAELHKRERYWLETLGATLNKCIPTRTVKEYREDNKENIAENKKNTMKKIKNLLLKYRKNIEKKIKKK